MLNRKFKKCLITGVGGSCGSYLAEYINTKSPKTLIYGTYRKKNRNIKNLPKKIRLVNCDLNNFLNLKKKIKLIKPDVIFHLASNADVRGSFDKPMEIIKNNNNCTLNLLEVIRELKLNPIIQICSTSEVYGVVSKKNIPISEKNIINPNNPYAVSKTFQDLLAQVYIKVFSLNIIITRMFTYINPRRTNLFATHWASQIARIERGKQKVLKHGNLNSTRTLIDIDDATNAYWLAATKGKIGEIYNIGANEGISIRKVLDILKRKSKIKIKSIIDKKLLRKTDIPLQIPSSKKFIKDTNWKQNFNLEKSLNKLLDECRSIEDSK
tara:strand:- start:1519 stop:2490 length:972 start_codon:yes stop_codon:yes gene_type:complete